MHGAVKSRSILGLEAHSITVECHIDGGLPGTTIVGLPESAVRESRDRVKSALSSSGFDFPDAKIVINLAPGHLTKSGTALDLPIALAVLASTGQIDANALQHFEFLGELGLFGELRRVRGALACALAARKDQRQLIIPACQDREASLAPENSVLLAETLVAITHFLSDQKRFPLIRPAPVHEQSQQTTGRFEHIIGQEAAKRALTLAAVGGHHLLMIGPPGTGKTLLARAFPYLLPELPEQERMEVAAVYSAAGYDRADYSRAPLRDPHHSATAPALLGGGSPPQPGEVALAHHGVLFLDELPHFKPSVLNHLREPIESGRAVITRASYKVTYPCRFQLIAAMNPCPAGRTCREDACRCDHGQVKRYQSRVSGPLLDRIDLHVQVPEVPEHVLADSTRAASSAPIDSRDVANLRQAQLARQGCLNADLGGDALEREISAAQLPRTLVAQAIERHRLSVRSFHKVWRTARTIADLGDVRTIARAHFIEALTFRALDWERGVEGGAHMERGVERGA